MCRFSISVLCKYQCIHIYAQTTTNTLIDIITFLYVYFNFPEVHVIISYIPKISNQTI